MTDHGTRTARHGQRLGVLRTLRFFSPWHAHPCRIARWWRFGWVVEVEVAPGSWTICVDKSIEDDQ